MKALLRDYAVAVGSYMALISLGLVLTLTLSSAVGYLPYSDRPGPGWTEPSFSLGQLGFYLSWSLLLLLPMAIYGTMLFAWLRVLSVLGTPRILLKVVAALGAGLLANVLAAGVGWYIAIAAFPVYVAAALGAGWGALLLPRYLGPRPPPRSGWMRWAGSSLVMLGGIGAAYWTFLAPPGGQTLSLSVIRVTLSEGERSDLEPQEAALLDSVLPKAHWQLVLGGSSSSGAGENRARMLIVITGPVRNEVRLREPKGVSVVYIQRGDTWEMFPSNAPTIRRVIKLGPGSKPNELTYAWNGLAGQTLTWNPD